MGGARREGRVGEAQGVGRVRGTAGGGEGSVEGMEGKEGVGDGNGKGGGRGYP